MRRPRGFCVGKERSRPENTLRNREGTLNQVPYRRELMTVDRER